MVRSVSQELANEIDALMVGDVGSGFLTERLAVKVLWVL